MRGAGFQWRQRLPSPEALAVLHAHCLTCMGYKNAVPQAANKLALVVMVIVQKPFAIILDALG